MKKSKFGIVRIILIALLAVVAILAIAGFAACTEESSSESKYIPIYEGMVISSAKEADETNGVQAYAAISNNVSGDFIGKNETPDTEAPFGDDAVSIEDEVEKEFGVVGGQDIYYANAGEDIYISVKFSNPNNYVILSFAINGETYASYMFESGSDMENIIIKINVGDEVGVNEYEISEIKYVDGTEIKDVLVYGETVVKCGVGSEDASAIVNVSNEVTGLDTVSFDVSIVDDYSLIAGSNGYAMAVIYDGKEIVDTTALIVGENKVIFENLTPDTLYQYAIVLVYDDLLGTGFCASYPYVNAVYTEAVVLFDNIDVGTGSISYDLVWHDGFDDSDVTRVIMSRDSDGVFVLTEFYAVKEISGLWSDTAYTLNITYLGINGTTEHIWLSFTTLANSAPTVEIMVSDKSNSALTFEIDFIDDEGIGEMTSIELYCDGTLVEAIGSVSNQVTFSNLELCKLYTLIVTYTYDLNDGNGAVYETAELSVFMDPIIEFSSVEALNTEDVDIDDSVSIQITMYNPNGAEFTSVVINNIIYNVSDSVQSTDGLYSIITVNILNDGQFIGGDTDFVLTEVNAVYDAYNYTVPINENNKVTVSVVAGIDLDAFTFDLVDGVYILTAYSGSEKIVKLPSSYNGHSYKIGERVFRNTSIEEVIISDGVTSIGTRAFDGCTSLKDITIGVNLTTFGGYAFDNCSALTNVYISDLGAWCEITSVNYYSNPLRYADNLYLNGELVTDVVVPDGVTYIGDMAFYNYTKLSSVVIPDSVTYIGRDAFYNCTSLTSVIIGNGVTRIEEDAFNNCTDLVNLTLGNNVC